MRFNHLIRPATPLIAAALATPAAAQRYNITDLGVATGYVTCQAQAINAAGQIVGTLYDATGTQPRAFLYSGGTMTLLNPTIPMTAPAINDNGRVAGSMMLSATEAHVFVYNSGILADLRTLGGPAGYGMGINRDGLVCGYSLTGEGRTHAFVSEGGVMYDIHVLAQATEYSSSTPPGTIALSNHSEAYDVNDGREVVGYFLAPASGGANTERAFYYRNEKLTELGTLGGDDSRALAISNNSQIVGWSHTAGGSQRAAIFYLNGQVRNLGAPTAAATWSAAYDVNDSGTIVGAADTSAFLYQGGVITDLNTLIPAGTGWHLVAATGVNNAGRITGYGTIGGQTHAFLLTPSTGPTPDDDGSDGGIFPGSLCGAGVGLPLLLVPLGLASRRRSARRR